MKIGFKIVGVFLILILLSGCFGNFQLTRNLYTWNSQVGDKFANTAVMWILFIIPAYEVCGFIDFFILNTIEFWSGENPLSMSEYEEDIQIVESEGVNYEIKATQNRFDITQLNGEDAGSTVAIIHDAADGSWYLQSGDKLEKIATLDGNLLTLNYPDGKNIRTRLY
ncbi:DUF3332 domain-containing protein [Candidatus Cloacimonadota bacterium]